MSRTPLLLLCAVTALAGCSTNRVLHAPVDVTIGQQLIDLKNARTSGALSDREYDEQRRLLIESVK
jgi:hypothetical protein